MKRAKDTWLRTLTHNLAEEPRGRRRMHRDGFDTSEPPSAMRSQISYSRKNKPILTQAAEKLYLKSPKPIVIRSKKWDMVLPSYFPLSQAMSRAQRRRDKRHYRNSEKFKRPSSYLRSQKISSTQDADMWHKWQRLASKSLLARKNALKY